MLWDTHMHCSFSGDSDTPAAAMVASSIEKGLDGICFTDHLDYDYKEEPGLFLLDFDSYQTEIYRLRTQYKDQLPILWGIEIGLQPHTLEQNRAVTAKYPFDFVIGSSHCVDCIDIYYPSFYENISESDAYRRYFDAILKNASSDADYDVYGHLDYVVRYGPNKNRFYSYEAYADIIDEILRTLIAKGKGIELNTAGFKYGLGHPNPTEAIIKRYRELGGEIITLGADGHKPEHVAYDFHKVPAILREAGFSYYTVFKNRKPKFYKLP